MEKSINILTVLLVIILCISGCFSPYQGAEGRFSITVGGGSTGRAALPWDPDVNIEDLTHTIHLSGPGAPQIVKIQGTQIVSFSVVPGKWKISVEGSLDGEVLSFGSATVNIVSGNNGSIPITMGKYIDPNTPPFYTFYAGTTADWDAAITAIANGGGNKEYVIILTDDFSVTGTTGNPTFGTSVTGIDVTIQGNKTITLNSNGSLLRIDTGQTVTVKDAQLIRQGAIGMNNTALVYIDGGEFVMETCSLISGNTSSTDSEGGGVHVQSGTFTMNGGAISGNTVENGGGVILRDGTFNMNGGKISGNTGTYNAGGVLVSGGTFTMKGGTISGNKATNKKIDGSTATSGGYGGGVYVEGTGAFALQGGTVYGSESTADLRNEAVYTYAGAALYVDGGTATYGTSPGTAFSTAPFGIETTITGAGP